MSDATAPEILSRAAAKQIGKASVPAGAELALHADMLIRFRDDNGKDVQLVVERKFLSPYYIWTRMEDGFSNSSTFEGFDGKLGWYKKDGAVQHYDRAEFETARRKLQRDIEETVLFSQVFFLGHLQQQLQDLKRLDDEEGHGLVAYVLEGEGSFQPPLVEAEKQDVLIRLWVDQASHHFMGARVDYRSTDQPTVTFCFTRHSANDQGVSIPRRMEIYYDKDSTPRSQIFVNRINFHARLKATEFAP